MSQNDAELLEEEELTLLSQFSIVIDKLKVFAMKVAKDSGFSPAHVRLLQTGLDHSVLSYIAKFQSYFQVHSAAIAKRDFDYFRALLPEAFQKYELSEENRLKGVQFIEAIESLLEDYNRE